MSKDAHASHFHMQLICMHNSSLLWNTERQSMQIHIYLRTLVVKQDTQLKGHKINSQQSAEKRKYSTNSLRGFNFHHVPLNVKFWMKGDQHALQNLWIKERKEGEGER